MTAISQGENQLCHGLPRSRPLPRPSTFFPMSRPGRTRTATPQDLAHHTSYGDSVYTKDDLHTRIMFQNVKGLTPSTSNEDFNYCLSSFHSLRTDIVGLSETNVPWLQAPHIQAAFRNSLRRQFGIGKVVFGASTHDVDPITHTDTFQAGGNLSFITGALVPTIEGSTTTVNLNDPTGMGRWCGMTIRGKGTSRLSVITAYRVCRGTIATAPLGSSFFREYTYLRESTNQPTNPREHCLSSLSTMVQELQRFGHAVILMMDANSTLQDDTSLKSFIQTCNLHDLHAVDPAPSTYMGSAHRRIDYIFGCCRVKASVQKTGSLSYYDGPQSDHRPLFIDLDLRSILGYTPELATVSPSATRLLKAGNPELVSTYVDHMLEYYTAHDMISRIDRLFENFQTMPRTAVRRQLEKWDSDQGRAMQSAEKALRKPLCKYKWSPALRNAGLIRQYWKLRLQDAVASTNHESRITRLESQIIQHDPKFRFPHRNSDLPAAEIRTHLNQATKSLRRIQQASDDHRQSTLYDLLAAYESGQTSLSPSESRRRARIVRRTLTTEACRGTFANIRHQIKPEERSGLQYINVPAEPLSTNLSTYQYLQQSFTPDILWERVVDRETIEKQILQYNRESFRAAASSPCGHGIIHDELTFTSLSPAAAQFLRGCI